MLNLVFPCLKFLQLRGTPAELPYRPQALPILVGLDVLLAVALYALVQQPNGALLALLSDGLRLILLGGVLWLRSRSTRFVQTATAVLGIGLLLNLLLLPPILILALAGMDFAAGVNDATTTHAAANFLNIIHNTLLVWFLLAQGQLLRHALELPYVASTLIALVIAIVEFLALTRLFALA